MGQVGTILSELLCLIGSSFGSCGYTTRSHLSQSGFEAVVH